MIHLSRLLSFIVGYAIGLTPYVCDVGTADVILTGALGLLVGLVVTVLLGN